MDRTTQRPYIKTQTVSNFIAEPWQSSVGKCQMSSLSMQNLPIHALGSHIILAVRMFRSFVDSLTKFVFMLTIHFRPLLCVVAYFLCVFVFVRLPSKKCCWFYLRLRPCGMVDETVCLCCCLYSHRHSLSFTLTTECVLFA